jgi:hypothetical protein
VVEHWLNYNYTSHPEFHLSISGAARGAVNVSLSLPGEDQVKILSMSSWWARSEQADHPSSFRIKTDLPEPCEIARKVHVRHARVAGHTWPGAETGHSLHVTQKRVQEARPC